MKNMVVLFLLVMIFALNSYANEPALKSIDGFSLPGTDGKIHSLSVYKDAQAVVVMFISTKCPVSKSFDARMAELADAYQNQGLVFVGVNSNKAEQMDEIITHAESNGFSFVVLKDENNVVADQFNAKVTPEIFVLHPEGDVLYHGRIDDSPDKEERKSEDLKDALDHLLAGNTVPVATTKAFGCSIKRVDN